MIEHISFVPVLQGRVYSRQWDVQCGTGWWHVDRTTSSLQRVGCHRTQSHLWCGTKFYMPITSSNINRFSKFLHYRNQEKICSKLALKILSHFISIFTLPCEMSDIALKPAMTMTNCMINVDWARHVASKQSELKFHQLCSFVGLFHKWFINVDNSRQFWSAINQTLRQFALSQRLVNRAICWSVTSPAWVHRPAAKRTHWTFDVKTEMLQLRWTITEAINRLFCCLFFRMCCYRHGLVFSCCFKDTDILLGSVATHLRCGEIFSDIVITNSLLIPTVKKI